MIRLVERLVFPRTELRRQDHRQIAHGSNPTLIASANTRLLIVGGAVVWVLGHGRISTITVDQSLTRGWLAISYRKSRRLHRQC
jgi:hypothetical protein